jgi:starch-binding outer membrane protein, SusD/RagB family
MIMTKNKLSYLFALMGIIAIANSSCKKQLQIGNPNSPTVSGNVTNESGLISLAEGGV